MEEIDQSIAVLRASFAELEPREPIQTKVSYNGVLMWKIEGFQRKRQDAINGVKTATLKVKNTQIHSVLEYNRHTFYRCPLPLKFYVVSIR